MNTSGWLSSYPTFRTEGAYNRGNRTATRELHSKERLAQDHSQAHNGVERSISSLVAIPRTAA